MGNDNINSGLAAAANTSGGRKEGPCVISQNALEKELKDLVWFFAKKGKIWAMDFQPTALWCKVGRCHKRARGGSLKPSRHPLVVPPLPLP